MAEHRAARAFAEVGRVRSHRAAISTVGCANIVTERLGARSPDIAVLTHQHGCGQLGDDTALTREILAGLAAHPNVSAGVLVSLGCETNAVGPLLAAVRERGGNADAVGIQAAGGVEAAVDRAERLLDSAGPPPDRPSGPAVIGVVTDLQTTARAGSIVEAVVDALASAGAAVLVPTELPTPARAPIAPSGHLAVPAIWASEPRTDSPVLAALRSRPLAPGVSRVPLAGDLVEQLTVLTAIGAQVLVSIVSRASLVGAALAPTICVAADAGLDRLDDLVDVPFGPPSLPARVTAEVAAVIAGRRTRAEHLGMRDLGMPRLGPSY